MRDSEQTRRIVARSIQGTRSIYVHADGYPATIETLNNVAIFRAAGIKFEALRRRGSLILARFVGGAEMIWRTATDLATFSRSQTAFFETTGKLIPTPTPSKIKSTWEPIAQLIRQVADLDAQELAPPLKDEFESILRATWERAGRPITDDSAVFVEILRECHSHERNYAGGPPRCCIWVSDGYCWVHQPSLSEFLSTPGAKNRLYPWDDVRTALLMLDFNPVEIHRSINGVGVHVRVWKGPLDVLSDDETPEALDQ